MENRHAYSSCEFDEICDEEKDKFSENLKEEFEKLKKMVNDKCVSNIFF